MATEQARSIETCECEPGSFDVVRGKLEASTDQAPVTAETAGDAKESKQTREQVNLVCNMTALDAEERRRYEALRREFGDAVQEVRESAEGYSFRLTREDAVLTGVARWMTFERRCCPFLSFALEVKGSEGPTWLHLNGPKGTKEFLKAELEARRGGGGYGQHE